MGSDTTPSATDDSYWTSRDFDYGVHDQVRHAAAQVRADIAARIRQAAYGDPNATGRDRYVYELAARIAEMG